MSLIETKESEEKVILVGVCLNEKDNIEESLDELKELWGTDYDYYYEFYQLDDLQNGIYHGRGEDLTNAMKKYIALKDDGATNPERQGCVAVDKELAGMLQMIMDKYTFQAEKSWTKLCYYYEYLGYQQ